MRRAFGRIALVVAAAGATGAGCKTTLRLPGPLNAPKEGALEPVTSAPDATRVLVLRAADGVRVQRVGMPQGFPLSPGLDRVHLEAGGVVRTAGPGRAEILWEGTSASVTLSGPGGARIGDRTRGEPLVFLGKVERARLILAPGDSIALPGGALLRGLPDQPGGPVIVGPCERGRCLIENQSIDDLPLELGGARLVLGGGAALEVPLLESVAAPRSAESFEGFAAGGLPLAVRGSAAWFEEGGVVRIEARAPTDLRGLGLSVHLEEGQSARLSSLRPGSAPEGIQAAPIPADETPERAAPESAPSEGPR